MRSTKSKLRKNNGMVYSSKRVYSETEYKKYRQYQDSYNKKNYRRFGIKLRKDSDKELIEWLESKDNVTHYLKQLIIADTHKQIPEG